MYHLKWITRQLARQKGYFTINIVGLAIAFSVSLLIYTYLMKEWQMDAFHEQNKHIYRITTQRTGIPHWNSEVCSQLGEFAKAEIPAVKDYTRIIPARKAKIKLENDSQYHTGINCTFADISFFNIFSFPWVSGNIPPSPQNRWAVISEQVARYYFNGENPVGKLIHTENLFGSNPDIPFHVIGVMKDIPSRSSIQADIILDFSVIEPLFRYNVGNAMRTFLLLSEHPNLSETEKATPPNRIQGNGESQSRRRNNTPATSRGNVSPLRPYTGLRYSFPARFRHIQPDLERDFSPDIIISFQQLPDHQPSANT